MLIYPNIDPVAIQLGPILIRWYGIAYLGSLLLGWWLLSRRLSRSPEPWPAGALADLVFYCTLGILIGGRLGSVIIYHPQQVFADPLQIFRIWEGGMSMHGGLIGSLLSVVFFCRKYGYAFFAVCDRVAPVVPLGLGLGRIGNFINGELWGIPSGLPWAMIFPHVDALPRHPSQLYQVLLEGVLLFTVLWWYSARPRPRMAVSGLFLLGYGLCRCAVEFVREPDRHLGYLAWGWLTMGQVLSFPMLLAGIVLLWLARRRTRRDKGERKNAGISTPLAAGPQSR